MYHLHIHRQRKTDDEAKIRGYQSHYWTRIGQRRKLSVAILDADSHATHVVVTKAYSAEIVHDNGKQPMIDHDICS